MLNPPQFLVGPDADEFRENCANFASFKNIDHLPLCRTLLKLAAKYRRNGIGSDAVSFCDTVVDLLSWCPESYLLRGYVNAKRGDGERAATDLRRAADTYAEFGMRDYEKSARALLKGIKVPIPDFENEEEAAERVQREVSLRQGQAGFRMALFSAYGERCAITGCDAEPVLEAAHIRPYAGKSTNDVRNGLLLRADIHTLFDLGELRIDPRSLKVIVNRALRQTEYGLLHGKKIRLPEREADAPSRKALAHRWKLFTDAPAR